MRTFVVCIQEANATAWTNNWFELYEADDDVHAAEQAQDAYPDDTIVGVIPLVNLNLNQAGLR